MISKRELRAININVDPLLQDKFMKKCEDDIPLDTKKPQIDHDQHDGFEKNLFNHKESKYDSPIPHQNNLQTSSNLMNKSSSIHILQKSISSLSRINSFQLIQNENLLEQSRPGYRHNEQKDEFQQFQIPFFFHQTSNNSITQLYCQNLTTKNWKYMIYDQSKNSCLPIFRCFGCNRQFQLPSALGGHLSKCHKKKLHQDTVKMLRQNRGLMRQKNSSYILENQLNKNNVRKSKRIKKIKIISLRT